MFSKKSNIKSKIQYNDFLSNLFINKKFQKINELISQYGYENVKDSNDNTILHYACIYKHIGFINSSLQLGADINSINKFNNTPLNIAVSKSSLEVINLLLINGANIFIPDNQGNFPLHNASKEADIYIVKILIDNGADIYCKNDLG